MPDLTVEVVDQYLSVAYESRPPAGQILDLVRATRLLGVTAELSPQEAKDTIRMASQLVELDDRRLLALGKIGRHDRYIANEAADGTLILTPPVIVPATWIEKYSEIAQQIENLASPPPAKGGDAPPVCSRRCGW